MTKLSKYLLILSILLLSFSVLANSSAKRMKKPEVKKQLSIWKNSVKKLSDKFSYNLRKAKGVFLKGKVYIVVPVKNFDPKAKYFGLFLIGTKDYVNVYRLKETDSGIVMEGKGRNKKIADGILKKVKIGNVSGVLIFLIPKGKAFELRITPLIKKGDKAPDTPMQVKVQFSEEEAVTAGAKG